MTSPITAQLILIAGDNTAFQPTIDLHNHSRSIGRAQNCDIIWGSLQISRQHATLEYMLPKWYIRDTSTNGLQINGVKIKKGDLQILNDQDIISFIPTGTVRYRFRYTPPPSPNRSALLARQTHRAISPQPSTSSAVLASTSSNATSRSIDNDNSTGSGSRSIEVIGLDSLDDEDDDDNSSNHSESLLSVEPDHPDEYFSFNSDRNAPSPSALGIESDESLEPNSVTKRKHIIDSSDDSDSGRLDRKKKRFQFGLSSDDDEASKSDVKACKSHCKSRVPGDAKLLTDGEIDQCNDVGALKEHLRECMMKLKRTELNLQTVEFDHAIEREAFRKKEHDVSSVNVAFREETYKKILELMESELSCVVCNEVFIQATVIDCGHTFCQFCINEWARKKTECPICRKAFRNRSHHIEMENFITRVFESFSDEIATRRKTSRKEREEQVIKAQEEARRQQAENQRGGNNFQAFIQSTAERYVDFLAELHQINEILGPRGGRGGPGATAGRRRSARIQVRDAENPNAPPVVAPEPPAPRRLPRGRRNAPAHPPVLENQIPRGQPFIPIVRSGAARTIPNIPVPAAVPVVTLNDSVDEPIASTATIRFPNMPNQFLNYVRRIQPLNMNEVGRGGGAPN